jgi:hypothetical protein
MQLFSTKLQHYTRHSMGKHFYQKLSKPRLVMSRYFSKHRHNACLQAKHNRVVVSATLIGYGTACSKKLLKQMAYNIAWHWNYPKATITIAGKTYRLCFEVKYQYLPNLQKQWVYNNRSLQNVFVRVESEIEFGVSVMDAVGANSGFFLVSNVGYKGASTEAHEYGHALGLWPGSATAHPEDLDQRGQGVPGLMYPRGTLVDPQYQYDPKVPAGERGGTVHPDTRRVRQVDIDVLMSTANLDHNSRFWNFGKLSNKYHGQKYGTTE